MESAISVSRGVFVFNSHVLKKKGNVKSKAKSKHLDTQNAIWYKSFKNMWSGIENQIEELNSSTFKQMLANLILYIKKSFKKRNEFFIPAAVLLTGINLPDHGALFSSLSNQIKLEATPHVVILRSDDCNNIKSLVENMVLQFINNFDSGGESDDESCKIKKSACTFPALESWYDNTYPWQLVESTSVSPKKRRKFKRYRRNLVIILPDFESFDPSVLQNFIKIVHLYLESIPFILIFGVATSIETLHNTLPYDVTSKMNIEIFHSQPSLSYLNKVLDTIFLSEKCVFYMSSKVFTLLTDIFLFYDFSVKGFIQGIKFSMFQHFYNNNAKALCCKKCDINSIVDSFTVDDLEQVRQLYSFRAYVEKHSNRDKIQLITNDDYFKICLKKELVNFHQYCTEFHVILKCLYILTYSLPKQPLGKQLRELYCYAVSQPIVSTSNFKESIQLLSFLSKDDLLDKITSIVNHLNEFIQHNETNSNIISVKSNFEEYALKTQSATLDNNRDDIENQNVNLFDKGISRAELKEKLLNHSKSQRSLNNYEIIRNQFIEYLCNICETYLKTPNSYPFYEIFFYEDVSELKSQIVGAPRAAIHTALTNPKHYMQCDCCELPNSTAIVPTLPDLSIAYKLHLECGKLINLYDWLQAFVTVIEPNIEMDDKNVIDPNIQARFTRVVAELQFLGFIKSSKKKTDHVSRLTWGN